VADPSDDTVRLAYADCIEEQGNAARAAFIRLQIEAERLHPDSNARLALEQQAEALFAEHWIEWWAEVCAAVDFPIPARKTPTALLRRLARWFWAENADNPYRQHGFDVWWPAARTVGDYGMPHVSEAGELSYVTFRRGFPELVALDMAQPEGLPAWASVSPLATLSCSRMIARGWDNGPHLSGVRELALTDCEPAVVEAVAQSRHLPFLDDLKVLNRQYVAEGVVVEEFADQAADVVRLLRGRNLKRLSIQVWTDAVATAVAEAAHLASLTALDADILPDVSDDYEGATRRVAALAQSLHLAGLQELAVGGLLDPEGYSALVHGPWRGLRKLTVNAEMFGDALVDRLAALLNHELLPALEELRIFSLFLRREVIDLLVRSPLVKQLRHLAFDAYAVNTIPDADLRRLPEMFDLDRLETFRFDPDHDVPGLDELKRQLGDRLRMP
jgi:uncharacterized protein (TIGR02996 family)